MVLFNDGQVGTTMETASDFSAWDNATTSGSAALTVSTDQPHHGANSAKHVLTDLGEDCYLYKAFADQTTLFFRFYIYIDSLAAATSSDRLHIGSIGGDYKELLSLAVEGTDYHLTRRYYASETLSSWDDSATTITLDAWHCIELKYVKDAAVGEVRIYIDGAEINDLTVTDLDTSGRNADFIYMGSNYGYDTGTVAATYYCDCAYVDTSYIGVEAAGGLSIPVAMNHLSTHISHKVKGG